MLGYTDAELRSLTCADLTDPDTLADDRALVQRLISGELPAYQTEKPYLRKDGSWLWASLITSLVCDAAGDPAYLISVVPGHQPAQSSRISRARAAAGTPGHSGAAGYRARTRQIFGAGAGHDRRAAPSFGCGYLVRRCRAHCDNAAPKPLECSACPQTARAF